MAKGWETALLKLLTIGEHYRIRNTLTKFINISNTRELKLL